MRPGGGESVQYGQSRDSGGAVSAMHVIVTALVRVRAIGAAAVMLGLVGMIHLAHVM